MSHGKQFTLFTHHSGPNGWKAAQILSELGLTYESIYLDWSKGEHKAPEYTKYCPNGRIPTIIDHADGDFVLWESNAILLYLVDKYDKEHKISAASEADKFYQLQWLFFQGTGQGPYYGQGVWFKHYHPERIPSAVERYQKEALRVLGVLESVLSNQEWLVGGKYTIADLSFFQWNNHGIPLILKDYDNFDFAKQFPAVHAWHEKIKARPAISTVLAIQASLPENKPS